MSDGEYVPTKTLVGEASKVAAFWAQRAIELEKQLTAKDAEIAVWKDNCEGVYTQNDNLSCELATAQRRIGELTEALTETDKYANDLRVSHNITTGMCVIAMHQRNSMLLTPKASGKQEEAK